MVYNMSMEQKKFKYLLSPENTYLIDYGDFTVEIGGSEIMKILMLEKYLDYVPQIKKPEEE